MPFRWYVPRPHPKPIELGSVQRSGNLREYLYSSSFLLTGLPHPPPRLLFLQ